MVSGIAAELTKTCPSSAKTCTGPRGRRDGDGPSPGDCRSPSRGRHTDSSDGDGGVFVTGWVHPGLGKRTERAKMIAWGGSVSIKDWYSQEKLVHKIALKCDFHIKN